MTMQPQAGQQQEQTGADERDREASTPIEGFGEMTLAARTAAILERHGEALEDVDGRSARRRPETTAGGTGDSDSPQEPPKDTPAPGTQDGKPADTSAGDSTPGTGADVDAPKSLEELPAYLEKLRQQHEEDTRQKLEQQKRSIVGEHREFQASLRQKALLEELDALPDDELRARVNRDPEAAAALASRANAGDPEVESRALMAVAARQTPQMFAAAKLIAEAGGPDLESIMDKGEGPDYEAITSSPGGVFSWLVQSAETTFVERYKKSPEYAAALDDARTQGKNDALGSMGQPAAVPRGTPSRPGQEPPSNNPRIRALQRAAERAGDSTVDVDELEEATGRRRRRGE